METKRIFIAINLPADLKRYIAERQQEFKNQISHVKWVEEKNFHLTLKFLGDVSVNSLKAITEAVKKVVDIVEPFCITIKDIGVFPKANQAKVIWLSIDEGKDKMISIFNKIDLALGEIGFIKENKVYEPHLTIGRCRVPQSIDLNKLNIDFDSRCKVNSVDIMMSELTPKGPNYTLIDSIHLNS